MLQPSRVLFSKMFGVGVQKSPCVACRTFLISTRIEVTMVRLVYHRTTICAGLAKATGVSWAFADRLPLCTLPFSGFFGREATGSDFSDGVSDPVCAVVHFYCPQRTLARGNVRIFQIPPGPSWWLPACPTEGHNLGRPSEWQMVCHVLGLAGRSA